MICQIALDAMVQRSTKKAYHAKNVMLQASYKPSSSKIWITFSKSKLENTALRSIRSSWWNTWSRRRRNSKRLFTRDMSVMGVTLVQLRVLDISARSDQITTFVKTVRKGSSHFHTQCLRSDTQTMLQRIWCASTLTPQTFQRRNQHQKFQKLMSIWLQSQTSLNPRNPKLLSKNALIYSSTTRI